jgi:hypothetical protein
MPQQFDPFSPPDEWFDSEWVNEEKCIKIEEDYQLDKFRIDMAYSTAATFFPSDSYSFEVIDDGYYTTKTMIFDSIELMFIKLTEEAEEEYELFTITLIDDSYITSRGLRVGDPVEKLYELYGTPRYVSDSVWSFCDSGGFYIRFSATVIDGVVRKASINQVL